MLGTLTEKDLFIGKPNGRHNYLVPPSRDSFALEQAPPGRLLRCNDSQLMGWSKEPFLAGLGTPLSRPQDTVMPGPTSLPLL